MPSSERVKEFVDAVVNGDHAQAIEDFYHTNATMQENLSPPRVGRDALVTHEKAMQSQIDKMETHIPKTYLIDGDEVVIFWTFDVTDKKGTKRRLSEIAYQIWEGDCISEEQFIYDTATAWQPV